MSKITSLRKYSKDSGRGVKNNVAIETAAGQVYHVSQKQWTSAGYKLDTLPIYVGSTFTASFYKRGDALADGQECTADNIILKSFSIELSITAGVISFIGGALMEQYGLTTVADAPATANVLNPVETDEGKD